MHPNWKALSTVHIPLKRFVTSSTEATPSREFRKKHEIKNVTGEEIKDFYETVTKEEGIKKKIPPPKADFGPKLSEKKVPFDKKTFFLAAMANDVDALQRFEYGAGDLDVTDSFGWTALIMAACEGAAGAVCCLLSLGADWSVTAGKGSTALSLAEKKGFVEISNVLRNVERRADDEAEEDEDDDVVFEKYFCRLCEQEFEETKPREHYTSTIHQFNLKREHRPYRFSVAADNRGLQMMLKQGWDRESGLGPSSSGHLFPIKTVIRKPRSGLGTKQSSARVTHFDAYDLRAVKYNPPPRQKNKSEMARDRRRERRKEQRLRKELA